MAHETKLQKAQRLLDSKAVTPLGAPTGAVGAYAVRGDTRAYLVAILPPQARRRALDLGVPPASCTCEARGACSHILAADAWYRGERRVGDAATAG